MNLPVNRSGLPSKYAIGSIVIANFQAAGRLYPCLITAVSFTDYGKVLYDLEVRPYPNDFGIEDGLENDDRVIKYYLKGVDSCAIESPADEILNQIIEEP